MKTPLALLVLTSGLVFSNSSLAARERGSPTCEMLISRLGIDASVARLVDRYWRDQTVDEIAHAIEWRRDFDLYKHPFAVDLLVRQRKDVLEIGVMRLANPNLTTRYFDFITVTQRSKTSPTYDPSLAKTIAGVLKGALARADLDRSVRTLVVQARGTNNWKLARLLEGLGFKKSYRWYSRKRGHVELGPHYNLEMSFELKPKLSL